ncbi:Hypothetical predicted protein [Paramuricea clavata]|uniref:Uncharacterized protein n=1 Tax=Paramuricea clavata TaxID=317549 RepID=A0A7D9LD89_PARCT|nr:Hypothetical predicted protein [Paramuricea clavata]
MIQKRQWRKDHCDGHYAAAIFQYKSELAVKFREVATFACLDDMHRIKVGEPGFPVAAAERGRRVLVRDGASFEVGDHNFTKFSLVPSVALVNGIPSALEDSWYCEQVIVTLKEGAFEPSSPLRHAAELKQSLCQQNTAENPMLFLYTDGGPDHRITYLSAQVALICLFLSLNLDYLLATRTAPYHSWRNPVERIMSTLNLGLQSIGLMRQAGDETFEKDMHKCNNMGDMRKKASKDDSFRTASLDSVAPVKVLLSKYFKDWN